MNAPETLIVTGGAGFIGSNFVRHVLGSTDLRVVVLDKLTYAGNVLNLKGLDPERTQLVQADIADRTAVRDLIARVQPNGIVNFAAETHVDRSIDGPRAFLDTNVVGVFELLEAARAYLATSPENRRARFRFLQISTDEVYGSLGESGAFTEETRYAPNSPYAATKAAADHLVRAYYVTYGLPTLLVNCSNNFGPYQFPEKLIPLTILNAWEGRPLPIYGDGLNVRDWLYVEDHCEALRLVLQTGVPGEHYNVGGNGERTNLEVVDGICEALEAICPARTNPALVKHRIPSYTALKTFVADRPGHDRRYPVDWRKIAATLGWRPRHTFESALAETVRWYLEQQDWRDAVAKGTYRRERLGLSFAAVEATT
jgi:dTDP-glucose 4,6-dehydratase